MMSLAALLAASALGAPLFAPHPCGNAAMTKAAIRCGVVTVPENEAGGRTIDLNVVVVPALSKKQGAAPLFHLEGGPGIAATTAALFYAGPGEDYRRHRDVVLVDQRGTGASHPLRCPALEARPPLELMYDIAMVQSCRAELEKVADLASYSTERAADDIDAVRRALGYEKISFWSLSYGTRLAQVYLKRHPDRVRSGVFVGFAPLDYRTPLFHAINAQRVLDLLFFKCQADADCSRRYPAFRDDWKRAVDPGPMSEAMRGLLGTAVGQRSVPSIVHAAAAGDRTPMMKAFPTDSSQFAEGTYLTIACSEGVARIDEDQITRSAAGTFLGDYRVRQEREACARWPKYAVTESFYAAPKTDVPLLVLSGEMDYVTAPDWGRRFCDVLPHCRFVLIPDLGHGPFDLQAWTHGECFDAIAAKFVDSGEVDASCVRQMRPPAFR